MDKRVWRVSLSGVVARFVSWQQSKVDPRTDDGDDRSVGGSRRVLRGFVTDALSLPTGSDLLEALADLMGRVDLSAREWVEVTAGWKRMEGYCAAGEADRCRGGRPISQP